MAIDEPDDIEFEEDEQPVEADEALDDERETTIALDEIPKEQRVLRTQAYDKSISDVVAMLERGDIVLDPEYQRNYVWDNKTASLLIESVLLNVPIPIIYVAEDQDSKWTVVDGLQRLNSLKRFFANEFKLRGLEVLTDLNRCQLSTLNPKAARLLRNGNLRIILIFKESHPDIKYDVFMRLNRGAVKLSAQELRNCLFRGSLNDLIMDLRKNKSFLDMLHLAAPHKRMADAELILRYFTISDSYDIGTGELRNYSGKVTSSLNKYHDAKQHCSPTEIAKLRSKFETTVKKVWSVFGHDAFQRHNADGTIDTRPNRAIMDFVMVSFEHSDYDKLVEHKDGIRLLLRDLPANDLRFNESITIGTSDKKQLEYRLNTWMREIGSILNS